MKHVSLLVATLLLGTSAFAAPPSTESLNQLLVATRMERSVGVAQQSLEQAVRNSINQGLQGKALTPQGQKVVDPNVFSAVVVMVIVTTMVTPPVLKWSLERGEKKQQHA
mgnify:CR=1 FL=1